MSSRYWSEQRFEALRNHVAAGEEPWASAHARLIRSADAAMAMDPVHIRMNGGSPWFRQDAVYIPGRDGVRNPQANRRCSELASQAGHACLTLAIAYRSTRDARYADKALQMIHAWCINTDTRMFPTGFVFDHATPGLGYGGDIVLMAEFPRLFLAMYLLRDYSGWALPARAAVKRWVRSMIEAQRELMFYKGYDMYNNWEDHRLEYLATGALAIDDADLLLQVFDRWRTTLPMKMTEDGELPRETERTRSMHYTLFALSATIHIADIADAYGIDLYDLVINGRSLKKAIDYAAGYLLDMDRWPHQMIEPLKRDEDGKVAGVALFESAYARWGDRRYLEIMQAYGGRPVAGHASLFTTRA